MRIKTNRQQGIASVEFVLIIPFMLVFILLAVKAFEVSKIRLLADEEARNMAWMAVMFGSECPDKLSFVRSVEEQFGGRLLPGKCKIHDQAAQRFDRIVTTGPERRYQGELYRDFVGRGNVPVIVQAESRFFYIISASDWLGDFLFKGSHAVDAAPVWELSVFPGGYDRYLEGQIGSDLLFPGYFPGANL
ncbi:MAG: hypothetical protein ACI909_003302 [Planctomycetota bacterium]|jgi:hypothetical protein